MRTITLVSSVLIALTGCATDSRSPKLEEHTVVRVYEVEPVTVVDQASPTYMAVLEDSNRLPVPAGTRTGQIFTFQTYK